MEDREERGRAPLALGIIVNPKHMSTHRAYATLVDALRGIGLRYRTMTTTRARDGAWQAEELVARGSDMVVILGGDGTIRAAGPVLADSGTPVLIVPTGTANVLSRHVGIASTGQAITHCLRVLATGLHRSRIRRIPINDVDIRHSNGSRRRTVFLSLAGIGGDARAVAHHHVAPGLLGYAWGAARALFAADLTLVGDEIGPCGDASTRDGAVRRSSTVWSVMASKAARPAGPVSVFPEARIDGDTFSVLSVGPLPRAVGGRMRAWTGIAVAALRGRPESDPLMDYREATEVTVRLTTPAPVQLDGDLIEDCVELRLRAGHRRLLVSVPAP